MPEVSWCQSTVCCLPRSPRRRWTWPGRRLGSGRPPTHRVPAAGAAGRGRRGSRLPLGCPPQGTIGVGWASLRELPSARAATSGLELLEVDAALTAIAGSAGAGSQARRRELLADLFGRATEPEQRFLSGLLLGEPAAGGARGSDGRGGGEGGRCSRGGSSAGAHALRRPGRGRGGGDRGRARGAVALPAHRAPTGPADARPDRRRRRSGPRARRTRRSSSGSSTAPASRRTVSGTRCALFTRNLADITDRVPEIVDAAPSAAGGGRDPRRGGDRARGGRQAPSLPGHDEPLREPGERRTAARDGPALRRSSSTASTWTATTSSTVRPRERLAALDAVLPEALRVPRVETAEAPRGAALPRGGARPRSRGRDGQGAGRPLRGRAPRGGLAEGEGGAHARPRRPRRRVGERSPDAGSSRTSTSGLATRTAAS